MTTEQQSSVPFRKELRSTLTTTAILYLFILGASIYVPGVERGIAAFVFLFIISFMSVVEWLTNRIERQNLPNCIVEVRQRCQNQWDKARLVEQARQAEQQETRWQMSIISMAIITAVCPTYGTLTPVFILMICLTFLAFRGWRWVVLQTIAIRVAGTALKHILKHPSHRDP